MTESTTPKPKEKASARDVDWNKPEIPIAVPSSGLSEGASLVKMKNGQIGVIQRGSHGMHNGVNILSSELVEAIKKLIS